MPARSKVVSAELAYARWARRLFAQPVGAEIYVLAERLDVHGHRASPATRVARLEWLFRNASRFADRSAARVGQAVWHLASDEYGELSVLQDARVKARARERAATAIALLFENLLTRVCRPELSHHAKSDEPADWANMACYMFWDICPLGPRSGDSQLGEPRSAALDAACLIAIEATLAIPHVACQEAALHGLGHWHRDYPKRVDAIVGTFLSCCRGFPKDLVAYAKQARAGCVR